LDLNIWVRLETMAWQKLSNHHGSDISSDCYLKHALLNWWWGYIARLMQCMCCILHISVIWKLVLDQLMAHLADHVRIKLSCSAKLDSIIRFKENMTSISQLFLMHKECTVKSVECFFFEWRPILRQPDCKAASMVESTTLPFIIFRPLSNICPCTSPLCIVIDSNAVCWKPFDFSACLLFALFSLMLWLQQHQ